MAGPREKSKWIKTARQLAQHLLKCPNLDDEIIILSDSGPVVPIAVDPYSDGAILVVCRTVEEAQEIERKNLEEKLTKATSESHTDTGA